MGKGQGKGETQAAHVQGGPSDVEGRRFVPAVHVQMREKNYGNDATAVIATYMQTCLTLCAKANQEMAEVRGKGHSTLSPSYSSSPPPAPRRGGGGGRGGWGEKEGEEKGEEGEE